MPIRSQERSTTPAAAQELADDDKVVDKAVAGLKRIALAKVELALGAK